MNVKLIEGYCKRVSIGTSGIEFCYGLSNKTADGERCWLQELHVTKGHMNTYRYLCTEVVTKFKKFFIFYFGNITLMEKKFWKLSIFFFPKNQYIYLMNTKYA